MGEHVALPSLVSNTVYNYTGSVYNVDFFFFNIIGPDERNTSTKNRAVLMMARWVGGGSTEFIKIFFVSKINRIVYGFSIGTPKYTWDDFFKISKQHF